MSFALGFLPIALLLAGFPIYLVLLSSSAVALVFFSNTPLNIIHQTMFGSIDAFALLAVPFFIYAGELMGRGSVAQRLVDAVQAGVGNVRGSLGVTTVGTSAIFGAISGVSAATVATVGRIMVPAMRRAKYPEHFSAGLITAVGAIDIIIPPSVPMIVYGVAAQESVPRLYAAGIFPGILIGLMLALYVIWYARRAGIPGGAPFEVGRFFGALRRGLWAAAAGLRRAVHRRARRRLELRRLRGHLRAGLRLRGRHLPHPRRGGRPPLRGRQRGVRRRLREPPQRQRQLRALRQ
ncbi:MAG: TRAP transporter large permease, partial [Betaproteobacteria bacterium]